MNAAIAGKDDEQFPGDDAEVAPSNAAGNAPAKSQSNQPVEKGPSPVRRGALAVKPAIVPAQKPATMASKRPLVKPALGSRSR